VNKENGQSISAEVEDIACETLPEIYIRTQTWQARQERLEKIQQARDSLKDLNELAEFEKIQSEIFIKECKNILKDNLAAGVKSNWASLYNDKPFPPFVYKKPAPRYNQVVRETNVPPKKFLSELLFPSVKNVRRQKENDAKAAYDLKMKHYEGEKEAQRDAHEKGRNAYVAEQTAYNSKVEELQLDFEKGQPAAVQSYARIVLNGITMPDSINVYFDSVYLPGEKQLVIDCLLPAYYDLPRTVSYQYVKEDGVIVPTEMGEQEFDAFYLSLIQQITLTAMHTVFNAIPARHVQWVGFNGLVENDKIGDTLESKACIIACGAARDVFAALDLSKSSPADCIHELKGLTAKSLAGTDTVKPIVSIEPLCDTDETKQEPDISKDGPNPPEYQPGEFKQITTKLVGEMLEQIEKNLLEVTGEKDDMIH
jgi:restriction system protein